MNNTESVGVITGIDGTDVNQINSEHRKEWATGVCEELEQIEYIEEAFIDSMTRNYSSVTIAAEVANTELSSGYEITANLRSISQHIRHTVANNKYASANILENTIESPTKLRNNMYNTCFYFITIRYP